MVWAGAEEGDCGRVLSAGIEARQRKGIEAAAWTCGCPGGKVSSNGRRGVASSMTSSTSCSTPTARWTKCAGLSSSARAGDARSGEGETLAAVDALGKSDGGKRRQLNDCCAQSPAVESVPAQGEPGPTLGLPLRGGDGTVLPKLDESVALATTGPFEKLAECYWTTWTAS